MKKFLTLGLLAMFAVSSYAQNYTNIFYYNLLNDKIYDYIVGESSGDLSYNQIVDIAGYEKNRTNEQYATMLHESKYRSEEHTSELQSH